MNFDKKMQDETSAIMDFVDMKHELLTRSYLGHNDIKEFDGLIKDAEALGMTASKAQLERYRDHYYPKEEK